MSVPIENIDLIHEILNNHVVAIPETWTTTRKIIKQEDLSKIAIEIDEAIKKELV